MMKYRIPTSHTAFVIHFQGIDRNSGNVGQVCNLPKHRKRIAEGRLKTCPTFIRR